MEKWKNYSTQDKDSRKKGLLWSILVLKSTNGSVVSNQPTFLRQESVNAVPDAPYL